MPKKVSQSGFRPVIVCLFAFPTIRDPPRHPKRTQNHQNFDEIPPDFGDFTPILVKFHGFLGDLEWNFTFF